MEDIDLIILDMVMPGMGGLAAYEHLKEINPDVKVILSSGYSLTGVVKEILDKGCDEYIQKPFSLSQISRTTRELLDKQIEIGGRCRFEKARSMIPIESLPVCLMRNMA